MSPKNNALTFPDAKPGDRVTTFGGGPVGIYVGLSPGSVEWIAWPKRGDGPFDLLIRAGKMAERLAN